MCLTGRRSDVHVDATTGLDIHLSTNGTLQSSASRVGPGENLVVLTSAGLCIALVAIGTRLRASSTSANTCAIIRIG